MIGAVTSMIKSTLVFIINFQNENIVSKYVILNCCCII